MQYKTSLAVGLDLEDHVRGYVSTYGNVDRVKDTVDPGAFYEAPYLRLPTLAYHNPEMPVATSDLTDDAHGLANATTFVPDDRDATKIRNLVRHGAVPAMSIGYDIPEGGAYTDPATGVQHLTRIDLMEVSFVPIPANPQARVLVAKAFGSEVDEALRYGMKSIFGEEPSDWMDAEEIVSDEMEAVRKAATALLMAYKRGARNSTKDQNMLDAAHDAIVKAGAYCGSEEYAEAEADGKGIPVDLELQLAILEQELSQT